MGNLSIKATKLFYRNLNSTAQVVCNRGGARSSKSYSIAQVLFLHKFFTEKNKQILVLRKTLPALKLSAYKTWRDFMALYDLGKRVQEEKQSLNYYYPANNNFMHFGSLDDAEKIKCFHPDTDILTKEGFKNIKDVKVGDIIVTCDPFTKKVEYKPITNFYVYDYDGQMLSPVSEIGDRDSYTGFCVTPEHKLLIKRQRQTKFEFREAKNLPTRFDLLQSVGKWDVGNIVEYFEIPKQDCTSASSSGQTSQVIYSKLENWKNLRNGRKTTKFPIKVWLQFLGWYLSEGNCDGDFTIKISQQKEEGRSKIREMLKEFPYHFKEYKDCFAIYGKDLCAYLRQFGDSHTKYIPREILNLHPDLLIYLYDALIAGDGWKANEKRDVYSTSSKQLMEDVCELGIKLGYVTLVEKRDTSKYYKNGAYNWAISLRKIESTWVSKISKVNYKGKVYCVEVLPYHTVLTRFNGRIMWCGQSTEWSYIWMQEATDFSLDDYLTLKLRLSVPTTKERNQIFMCFNPIDEYHWIKTKLIDPKIEDVDEIYSTYKDNKFLSEDYVKTIEQMQFIDNNKYRVYALGEWGRLENLIYTNWDIEQEYITKGEEIYGLDFGFNNPCALVRLKINGNDIFEEEMIYETEMITKDLIKRMYEMNISKRVPIYADPAEPDRIKELRSEGFNIIEANKEVIPGIDFVKRFKIHCYKYSLNLIREHQSYSWRKDKQGRVLEEPVKFNDHCMDACRYAIFTALASRFDTMNIRFI